jgi:hypothetical protein
VCAFAQRDSRCFGVNRGVLEAPSRPTVPTMQRPQWWIYEQIIERDKAKQQ